MVGCLVFVEYAFGSLSAPLVSTCPFTVVSYLMLQGHVLGLLLPKGGGYTW